jgi:tetratricopeptide (TPR) repeat protein
MLGCVDSGAWAGMPTPQRLAMDWVLLRGSADDIVTDSRSVAAGFLSLIERLEKTAPVLLAIDDLQWLDSSSRQVIAFAAQRFSGRVGMLATVRSSSDGGGDTSWLQLPRLAETHRIPVGPLSLGGLRAVLSERLGRSLSRLTMVRIYEVSRGNPFYAIELARDHHETGSGVRLPGSLAELVRTRVGTLPADVQNVLLAASCISAPSVELLAGATGHDAERVVALLTDAENKGIVRIDGHRLNFTHPLLARGIYSEATAAQRRKIHRRLADLVEEPELQARHRAMAVAWGDRHTLECLDRAADIARMRGAPAAAELIDLAISLGGLTAERRIRLADNHFDAGDWPRARILLEQTIGELKPGRLRAEALSVLGPVRIFGDSFLEGVAALERSLDEAPDDLDLRVPALITLSLTLFNTGRLDPAWCRVQDAVTEAARLGEPLLLSQALSLRVLLGFLRGEGIDDASLQSALEMEERYTDTAIRSGFQKIVRPRSHHALLLGWTGRLERAHEAMVSLRQSCVETGLEHELIYVVYYSIQVEIWRGNFTEAALLAEQGMEGALQLGSDVAIGGALTFRAALAAYAGNEQQVRRDVRAALAALQGCGAHMLEGWPLAIIGFLELSLGNHEAALTTLEPLLANLRMAPERTEIYLAEFVPDAVEALVHLGRLDEAEPLVEALEHNGRRLDRAWMLAVGARCRGVLAAAHGDLDAARRAAEAAMAEHERLPMPFERARTELLLGRLQRRLGYRDAATKTLRDALETFEHLNIHLWADRARAELARADMGSGGCAGELTPSEQQVADLVVCHTNS